MRHIPYTLFLLAASAGLATAQATSYSDPVGYLTTTIAGNTASNPSGAWTYVSATLVQPTDFAGEATSSPSGGSIVNFSGNVPATFDGSYVLEIADGSQEGWWTTVVSSTATSVTVLDTFPDSLAANVKVIVKKFNTVKSLFGSNTPGLNPFDGGVTQADEIQFIQPGGAIDTVIYLPEVLSGEPDQWFDFVGGVNADNRIIYPGTAVKVIRYGATSASLVSAGTVKTTSTQIDVLAEENWLSVPIAAEGNYGNMNFFPQLVAFDAGTTPNDFIELLALDQSITSYVALSADLGGGYIMDFVQGTDASAVALAGGTGYVLKRDPTQSPSILTIPPQVIGN